MRVVSDSRQCFWYPSLQCLNAPCSRENPGICRLCHPMFVVHRVKRLLRAACKLGIFWEALICFTPPSVPTKAEGKAPDKHIFVLTLPLAPVAGTALGYCTACWGSGEPGGSWTCSRNLWPLPQEASCKPIIPKSRGRNSLAKLMNMASLALSMPLTAALQQGFH